MASSRRCAVVTGGRRGIGQGICFALASAGFDVAVVDLEDDEASQATLVGLRERGARAQFIRGDIAAVATHASIVDAVYGAFGTLDCLVNNAGVSAQKRGDLLDLHPESFDRVVGVNLRGTFFLTQAAARRMVAEPRAPEAPARSIITISSINAWLVGPDRGEYCISKTGLTMMTQTLRRAACPASDPHLRDPARHHRHRHDGGGQGKIRPPDRRRPHADRALGHARGRRGRQRRRWQPEPFRSVPATLTTSTAACIFTRSDSGVAAGRSIKRGRLSERIRRLDGAPPADEP